MKTQNKRLNEPVIRIISLVKKALTRSPFDKWVGRLKHLEGRGSDDIVGEARGHEKSR